MRPPVTGVRWVQTGGRRAPAEGRLGRENEVRDSWVNPCGWLGEEELLESELGM